MRIKIELFADFKKLAQMDTCEISVSNKEGMEWVYLYEVLSKLEQELLPLKGKLVYFDQEGNINISVMALKENQILNSEDKIYQGNLIKVFPLFIGG